VLVVWSWLRELVELPDDVGPDDAARALTGAGLEVEEVREIGGDFSGVVIAEVVGKKKHPKADKLTLVDVITEPGGAPTQVVCGAQNVPEPGGRVLWAPPGATLPGGFTLAPKEIKGVVSPGMLCAEDELGLSEDHEGIAVLEAHELEAPLGSDPAETLGLRDFVFDVGVPANRPDCFGHFGLARELAALCNGRLREVDADLESVTNAKLDAGSLCSVEIHAEARCARYVARVIDDLSVAPSPRWMRQRLNAVGVRPISNLVDVTNYVMFELGQPLHAFDAAHVKDGALGVRLANKGEKITTLDDVERELSPDDLLIIDPTGPIAIAGVMGGATSEVSGSTRRILLESAHFGAAGTRRTSKKLNLRSEASHRFERGVDPNGADLASRRAALLLARLGGGSVASGAVDAYPVEVPRRVVSIRPARTSLLTGIEFSATQVRDILRSLSLEVDEPTGAGADASLAVTIPTSRPDLQREVDLIEEVIRMYGFDEVPATLPTSDVPPRAVLDRRERVAARALAQAGLRELVNFAFTGPQRLAALRLADDDPRATPIPIKNPLKVDDSLMRTTLLPNLLGAAERNLKRGNANLGLFEVGAVFLPPTDEDQRRQGLAYEPRHAAGLLCGDRPGWLAPPAAVDFFDAKQVVERLLSALLGPAAAAVRYELDAGESYLHPGVSARIFAPTAEGASAQVGVVGEVHPDSRDALDIPVPVFAFEIDLESLPPVPVAQLQPISRFPSTSRDVSMFVDETLPAARVRAIISACDEPLVEDVAVLEDYRDPAHVPAGKKGMLWSISYRADDRTLTDAEVDKVHEGMVARLLSELPAERR